MDKPEQWAEWSLDGLRVTQIRLDQALHIHMWSLEKDLLLWLGTPFMFRDRAGNEFRVDPSVVSDTIPVLPVLGSNARLFRASSHSRCELVTDFGVVSAEIHPRFEAWYSEGSGDLEGANLLSPIGSGSPWGSGPPPTVAAV